MNNKRENEVLLDLAKLIVKYGPEAFESLAHSILTPEFAKDLSDILFQIAKIHRKTPSKQRKKRRGKG